MSFDLKIHKGQLVLKNSDIKAVSGNEKLAQDIAKILVTKLKSNKYHPAYGSSVGALEIGSVPDQNLLEADLQASAEDAIRKIINIQRNQVKKQFLSSDEIIISVKDVVVQRNTADPRLYTVFVSVLTQSMSVTTESITIRVL